MSRYSFYPLNDTMMFDTIRVYYMGKILGEALGISPVRLMTIKDAGVAMRDLYPMLRDRAEELSPRSVSGVHSLVDSPNRRILDGPKEVTVATPLPKISKFRDIVMIGATTDEKGQWIQAPYFLAEAALPPEVIFGKELKNYGRPGEYYITDPTEKIVFHRPLRRREDPELVLHVPPLEILDDHRIIHDIVTGVLNFELAA